MSIVTTSLTALAIAASVLAPAGAGAALAAPAEASHSQVASATPSIGSVDWFKTRDKVVTGIAGPGTATVRISGLALAPGAYREGVVNPDGSFTVNLAPFASRAIPLSTLTATAVGADGTIGGSVNFTVNLGAKPAASAASTVSSVSQKAVTGVQADAIRVGATAVTGDVPVGSQEVAVDVFGSTVFGEIDADGSFDIDLGDYAAYSVVGVTFEVWATAADGSVLPSQFVPVTV